MKVKISTHYDRSKQMYIHTCTYFVLGMFKWAILAQFPSFSVQAFWKYFPDKSWQKAHMTSHMRSGATKYFADLRLLTVLSWLHWVPSEPHTETYNKRLLSLPQCLVTKKSATDIMIYAWKKSITKKLKQTN